MKGGDGRVDCGRSYTAISLTMWEHSGPNPSEIVWEEEHRAEKYALHIREMFRRETMC